MIFTFYSNAANALVTCISEKGRSIAEATIVVFNILFLKLNWILLKK